MEVKIFSLLFNIITTTRCNRAVAKIKENNSFVFY